MHHSQAAYLPSAFQTMVSSTYELQCSNSNPDKIHYDKGAAFRNENYRQMFHQDGKIGTFQVRLLEAADLDRRYWSALALGPMKHLGLSKAHGEISSYVSFGLAVDDNSNNDKVSVKGVHRRHQFLSTYVSPVVPNTNSPVWTECQFELPLRKGALHDGAPVQLFLKVEEDSTTLENIIPGIASAGTMAKLLGIGQLDVTELCLGQHPLTGRPVTGVLDAWVPIRLPDEHEQSGRVRVLITYHPNGMNPQRNDIVALEAFARKNLEGATTCISIIPPLLPLYVVEVKEPWVLVKYELPVKNENGESRRIACMRIHRNAVFVIERKNIIDATVNIVLMPAEFVLNTPVGRNAQEACGPLIVASKQLIMPAILSSKLVWMALRTTALASLKGVAAAGTAFFSEGTNSLTKDGKKMRSKTFHENDILRYV